MAMRVVVVFSPAVAFFIMFGTTGSTPFEAFLSWAAGEFFPSSAPLPTVTSSSLSDTLPSLRLFESDELSPAILFESVTSAFLTSSEDFESAALLSFRADAFSDFTSFVSDAASSLSDSDSEDVSDLPSVPSAVSGVSDFANDSPELSPLSVTFSLSPAVSLSEIEPSVSDEPASLEYPASLSSDSVPLSDSGLPSEDSDS